MAATYNNLYLEARKRLREAGVEGAQLEARELVCCAAGKSREQFYRDMALYASDPVEEKLAELLGQQGIQIARRTVAKYRTELRLGSAAARKRD